MIQVQLPARVVVRLSCFVAKGCRHLRIIPAIHLLVFFLKQKPSIFYNANFEHSSSYIIIQFFKGIFFFRGWGDILTSPGRLKTTLWPTGLVPKPTDLSQNEEGQLVGNKRPIRGAKCAGRFLLHLKPVGLADPSENRQCLKANKYLFEKKANQHLISMEDTKSIYLGGRGSYEKH